MLIIEIALAVAAWRRGWKGRALLPFAYGLPLLFVVGLIATAAGAGNGIVTVIGLLGDLAIVVALVRMVRNPRAAVAGSPYRDALRDTEKADRVSPRAA